MALGADAGERNRKVRSLIRSGHIRLGGNKKLGIYGLLSCKSGKQMKAANRVFFDTVAAAIKSGYRPCGHCMPREYALWKAGLVL